MHTVLSKASRLQNTPYKTMFPNSLSLDHTNPTTSNPPNLDCLVMPSRRPFVLHSRTITSTGGGPDKTILNSPRYLKQLGYDSACMFFRPPNDEGFQVQRERAMQAEAALIEIEDRRRLDANAIKSAITHCRELNVDIWHAHDYKTNMIGLIARRFHPMKLVTTAHGWVNFDGNTPIYYRLDRRWFLPRYGKVICVSDTVLQQCLQAGIEESHCCLIENAIDTQQFKRTRALHEAKAAEFSVQREQLVIGSIGRLADEKGFDLLIEAFCRLLDDGIDAQLVIAGEGPEEAALHEQIGRSGKQDRIRLLGFRKDTRGFFEGLDAFVLSSHREGLPNVLLEAMAVGVPVIATRVGGVERVVQDNINGLLISSGSVEEIHTALKRIITSKQDREALRSAGIASIENKWSFSKRMDAVVDIYQNIMAE